MILLKSQHQGKILSLPPPPSDFNNLLLKGNNLLALHTLKSVSSIYGNVKLIYIDPPYNTGNDSFNYNDNFNHSSWLVFMKNRLEIAREFLRDDGVIFIQCDDNEQAYLKVLCDEIFGRENFVGDFIRKTKSTTNDAKIGVNIQHENCLCFAKDKNNISFLGGEKDLSKYKNPDNDPNGDWVGADPSAKSGNPHTGYFAVKNPYTGKEDYPPVGRFWNFSQNTIQRHIDEGRICFKKEHKENERGFIYKRYLKDLKTNLRTFDSLEFTTNEYMNQVATKEAISLEIVDLFRYPKPEALLKRIIEVSTQKGDLVMDFFAGSGTTLAVAHKMGRRWVGIEQMDYIENITKQRLSKVVLGEQGGVSKLVGWDPKNLLGDALPNSFLYAELMPLNEAYKNLIIEATEQNITEIISKMQKNAFLNYRIDFVKTTKDSDFEALSLEDKKHILLNCLDMNLSYVPLSEMEDSEFEIPETLIKANKIFYGGKK
ncbi:site-specific DNA-methyltransferase [Helicobacter sp. 13S00482-2]|uniref:site-specific DNA-methyltransferase n=1 Tax=Helicobacter sp. 13S00482-2 TaxID=1476200 RepID=UPI000BA64E2F|nr:site-specific DNA-methyltransferase [Helicobacter sp. 13S00482-2]